MKKIYVITYIGNCHTKVWSGHGFQDIFIGKGIVHESPPLKIYPPIELIEEFKPNKHFDYVKVEERYVDDSDFVLHHK